MPYAHQCPKHGVEPCPNMADINDGFHVCRDDATVRFKGDAIPTLIPIEVG